MMAVTWGTPTPVTTRVVQMLPGPMPTFTASTPRLHHLARAGLGGDVARHELHVGKRLPELRHGPQHAFAVPVGGVDHEHVHAGVHQALRAAGGVGAAADGGGHAQPAVLVLVGVGMLAALEDVLDGDQALEHALGVHDRQLLDPVLGQDPLGLVEAGADRRGDQLLLASSRPGSAGRGSARTGDRGW